MTNYFNVMVIGIEHEGAVVVGVIMRSRPGCAVVAPSGRKCARVKGIHQRALGDAEGDVHRGSVGRALGDQKSALGAHRSRRRRRCR